MGVTGQILIHKTSKSVFHAGETVKGIVKYIIDKPTEYNAVTLSLLGIGKCKFIGQDSDQSYCHGSEEYVTIHINLLRSHHPVQLQKGSYEHPFQFRLPDNIPPSFKSPKCKIKYRIQIKFEKSSLFSFNQKFYADIPVYGHVKSGFKEPVTFGLKKTLFKLFSNKTHCIELDGVLENACLCPGAFAKLNIRVQNDTDETPTVHANIYCKTILIANNKMTHKMREKVHECFVITSAITKRSVVNITLKVPIKSDLYTVYCKIVKKSYVLKIEVRLPAPHKNPVIEIPIVIGERKDTGVAVECVPIWEFMLKDDK